MWRVYKNIRTVDQLLPLKPYEFKELLTDLFREQGYRVFPVSRPDDCGASFIMMKDGKVISVQPLQYVGTVGYDAVTVAYRDRRTLDVDEAWVVSPYGFTDRAKSAAQNSGVRLVSGTEILQMLAPFADTPAGGQPTPQTSPEELYTLAGDVQDKLVQYHGRERDIVIPQDLGVRWIGSHAFGRPWIGGELLEGFTRPVCEWRGIRSVVIPEGVKGIGYSAFEDCTYLESVTLPSTLEYIGIAAFKDCESLSEIVLPESLREIGFGAFSGCKSLSGVRTPMGLKMIGDCAFEGCDGLTSIELPDSLSEIGKGAFKGCSHLLDIRIPSCVETIRSETFLGCEKLASVKLSDGLNTIESRAFGQCRQLEEVELPESIEVLSPHAFEGCESLRKVTVAGEGCRATFHRSAFAGCPVASESAPISNLPSAATLVNDAAFPGMFDGPAHELHALRFDTRTVDFSYGSSRGLIVVDPGAEGLNSYLGSGLSSGTVEIRVELNDSCSQGFCAVKNSVTDPYWTEPVKEAHLEPKGDEKGGDDPSRHRFVYLEAPFFVYLHNCHLVPSPLVDGAEAACVEEAYRNKVVPLAEEYQRVRADKSGRGKRFEREKLATLDGLHEKIKATNEQFKVDAEAVGLSAEHYIAAYARGFGSGIAPSEVAAKTKAAKDREVARKRPESGEQLMGCLAEGCYYGCFMIVMFFSFICCMIALIMILLA